MAYKNLIRLVNEIIFSEYDSEKIISDSIMSIFKNPGQLFALVFDEENDKILCLEYDSVEYKVKENMHGSDPDIDEYCLVLIIKDDICYDKYFQHDITDEMITEIKQIWNDN